MIEIPSFVPTISIRSLERDLQIILYTSFLTVQSILTYLNHGGLFHV